MNLKIKTKGKRDKNSVHLAISDYFVLLFMLWGFGRITLGIYRPILMVIALLWIFSVLPSFRKGYFFKDQAVVSYIFFLILYAVQIPLSKDIGVAVSYFGAYALYLILILMFDYYVYYNRKEQMFRICKITISWIILLCCFAILYYLKYPGIARLHATHRSELNGLMIGGGYQIAYICSLLLPYLATKVFNKKADFKSYIAIVIMLVLLWETTSVITMVSALLGCCIAFAFAGEKRRKIIFFVSAFVLVSLFLIFRGVIGQFLIDLSADRIVTSYADMNNATFVRLKEISMMLQGASVNSTVAFSLRLQNFIRPLEDIVKHPVFGSLFTTGVNPENANYNDSSVITAFVCWGIPMAMLYLFPLFKKMGEYSAYVGSVIAMILMMLFNPSEGFSIYAGGFFILPCLALMEKNYYKNVNTMIVERIETD